MKIALYSILAFLPSIIWLAFYLRKDKHPEPNKLILKIFIFGIIIAIPALILEWLFFEALNNPILNILKSVTIIILVSAFIEEYLKYLVVRLGILKHPEFDEPVDGMIYLIIAALGFAAAENIFLLFFSKSPILIPDAPKIMIFRFLGAVFLHALASAIIGYFLVKSMLQGSKGLSRLGFMATGIIFATLLHGLYNYIIILGGALQILLLAILLCGMAIIVSWAFKKVNKLRAICKI